MRKLIEKSEWIQALEKFDIEFGGWSWQKCLYSTASKSLDEECNWQSYLGYNYNLFLLSDDYKKPVDMIPSSTKGRLECLALLHQLNFCDSNGEIIKIGRGVFCAESIEMLHLQGRLERSSSFDWFEGCHRYNTEEVLKSWDMLWKIRLLSKEDINSHQGYGNSPGDTLLGQLLIRYQFTRKTDYKADYEALVMWLVGHEADLNRKIEGKTIMD